MRDYVDTMYATINGQFQTSPQSTQARREFGRCFAEVNFGLLYALQSSRHVFALSIQKSVNTDYLCFFSVLQYQSVSATAGTRVYRRERTTSDS